MRRDITIGLVVPFAVDEVPFEGPIMYPGVRFIPRGVGVRARDDGSLLLFRWLLSRGLLFREL